jgi:hypothetical protein
MLTFDGSDCTVQLFEGTGLLHILELPGGFTNAALLAGWNYERTEATQQRVNVMLRNQEFQERVL